MALFTAWLEKNDFSKQVNIDRMKESEVNCWPLIIFLKGFDSEVTGRREARRGGGGGGGSG